ncbi:AI-2E family transporter [Helcococcus kunzii]|uniref:AI-2E family transporter n=1 Tax=Helcococcus kunzii TaxID=40091 RepID=UPI0021A859AE|nr:AI-2E family transporter [Helcococcus kunzii]MCT1796644.1 AI-2E family transporter [Helcococcus kunzii]MCT1988712.1 AI-2E family transporter [Helcococcus kunzii]
MFLRNSTIAPVFQYTLYILIIIGVIIGIYYLIYIGNKHLDEDKRITINWNRLLKILLTILLSVVVISLYKKYPILGSTTFAVFLAIILAFLLNPIVNKLESKGIKRSLGTIIAYIAIVAIFALLGISIVPTLVEESSKFLSNLPSSINNVMVTINNTLENWNINADMLNTIQQNVNKALTDLTAYLPGLTTSLLNTIAGSFSTMVVMVLIPIITFFLLTDKDKILKKGYKLIPKKYKADAIYLYKEINFGMSEFVRSRLLMAVFIGAATWLTLELFGIPFALVIGILTMICDVIPYIGPVLATAPALIFAFIKSPITFLWIGFLSMLLQWIEQNIVGAKLMSVSSGIHEIVVLISIIIGGGTFGVWGMILAVPIVITINILYQFVKLKINGIQPIFTKDKEKEEAIARKKAKQARKNK